jgi:hypothetical protein
MQQITFSNTQVGVVKDESDPSIRIIQIAEVLPIQVPGAPPIVTRVYTLALDGETAKTVGSQLLAPSLEIASTIDMPSPNGNGKR